MGRIDGSRSVIPPRNSCTNGRAAVTASMMTGMNSLSILEKQGRSSTYWLRQNGISPTIVNKLKKNEQIATGTIERLCRLLNCQPGDIMEYEEEK